MLQTDTRLGLAESESDEMLTVLRWRFNQLSRAGFAPEDAVQVAVSLDVDLHEAVRLLDAGCPPKTALRILV